MKHLLGLLRSPAPSTVELRKALSQIDVAAFEAELQRLKTERATLLMEGDDKTLDALEARIASAARQVERSVILQDQITASLNEAEAREVVEALSRERAAVEAEAAATAKALKVQYPKIALEMVALLNRLDASEQAVKAMNKKLQDAGRDNELLKEVETRAFPLGPHDYGPDRSVLGRTTLAEKPGLCPGYNDRPDTGGWVIQNPTGTALEMQGANFVNTTPVGGFVDTSSRV